MIAEFLIAAIALVDGVEQHVNGKGKVLLTEVVAAFKRSVSGRIVYDEHRDIIDVEQSLRNAPHHFGDGLFGVVSNDKYQDARSIYSRHRQPFLRVTYELERRN